MESAEGGVNRNRSPTTAVMETTGPTLEPGRQHRQNGHHQNLDDGQYGGHVKLLTGDGVAVDLGFDGGPT